MVKTLTSKKRHGIGRGVQKRTFRVSDSPDNSSDGMAVLSRFAQLCWNYQIRACSALLLLPFEVSSSDGMWLFWGSPLRLVGHYVVLSIAALFAAFRFVVTVQQAVLEELDLTTYLCTCYFLISLALICSAMGSTWMGREMAQLLNSTQRVLDCFAHIAGGQEKGLQLWGSTAPCLKLICLTWIAQVTALNASAFSLVFDSLPVCLFPIARGLGVLPQEEVLPNVFSKLLFYPLEFVTLLSATYLLMLNISTVVVSFRVLDVSANLLRCNFRFAQVETD